MTRVEVEVSLEQYRKSMRGNAEQVPYAASVALNETAKDIQRAAQKGMEKKFNFKRASSLKWAQRGVKITHWAKKSSLYSEITVKHQGNDPDFFARFEEGGRVGPTEGTYRAIPIGIWTNRSRSIPKSKRPHNLKNKWFIRHRGTPAIMTKTGKSKRAKTIFAYILRKTVQIPAILGFRKTFKGVTESKWEKNWKAAWAKAISTKR